MSFDLWEKKLMKDEPISVMLNGLPGKMAREVLKLLKADARFRIVPFAFTGPEIIEVPEDISSEGISLVHYENTDGEWWDQIKTDFPNLIAVDFTHPTVANQNAEHYRYHDTSFVMGTTGGDREALVASVTRGHGHCAVIAPNMAKQVVTLQAMLEFAAQTFPEAFVGYSLEVRESHQKGKADTSGTAKAIVNYFNELGVSFSIDQIFMIRDEETQLAMGIPVQHLGGHGWHTYTLKSADDNVMFEFVHNICGRTIYAEGTRDAILFLHQCIVNGAQRRAFSMLDVLKGV